jgi:GDP-L-fucose synthase
VSTPNPGRVLVLGADGFVGRNLVRWLERQGYPFHPIGKAAGDLTDPTVADAAFKAAPACDLIVHAVTRQRTGPVQLEIQGELLSINARLHLNVLEAWRQHQPQAMLLSTGSSCTYPESETPITEDMFGQPPLHPSVRGYAQAKMILARGSEFYGEQYGLRWLHCILATLYGPYDHTAPDRSHFFGAMLNRAVREKAEGAERFTVWGSPDVVRELLYVEDQIEALMVARGAFENRILNCAANAPISIGEAAEAIRATLKWDARIEYPQGTFVSTPRKVLDSSVFLEGAGWSPRWSLPAGIEATLSAG